MHDRPATYSFFQHAVRTGDDVALEVAMLAATFIDPAGVNVGTVRAATNGCSGPWVPTLLSTIAHLQDSDTIGRFRQLQNAWNTWMRADRKAWAAGLQQVANASSVQAAFTNARALQALQGAGIYQLGQILHLLHPSWFCIVNRRSRQFWTALGYQIGGVDNLESISADYRDTLIRLGLDFNVIDELFSD